MAKLLTKVLKKIQAAMPFAEAVKKGIITEDGVYTSKGLEMAFEAWKKANPKLYELYTKEYFNKEIKDYHDVLNREKNFCKFWDSLTPQKQDEIAKEFKKEYGIRFNPYTVSIKDYLPEIDIGDEEDEDEEELLSEEINFGKLTEEQVDKLDIKLDNLVKTIENNGGELYYSIRTNDKGETIVLFEGDAPYWEHIEEIGANLKMAKQITYEEYKSLYDEIEDYIEGLKAEQERSYGELNYNIKVYGEGGPPLEVIEELEKEGIEISEDELTEFDWNFRESLIEEAIKQIEKIDKYWESSIEGRSGGWFVVNGPLYDLENLRLDLQDYLDEKIFNEDIKDATSKYYEVKKEFKEIKQKIKKVENVIEEMLKIYKETPKTEWKKMLKDTFGK